MAFIGCAAARGVGRQPTHFGAYWAAPLEI